MTVAIIQARMGSSRLPGKVLAELGGRTMLERVVERARSARRITRVVVATSQSSEDDRIEEVCRAGEIGVFRGSEHDVLDRYAAAARRFGADPIVRLTGDCPLLDPAVTDTVIAAFEGGGFDYVANINPPTYPDGLDTEVIAAPALERAAGEARLKSEREHVTLYIRNHREKFRVGNVRADRDLSALRWTVDEPEDLEVVRAIYARLGTRPFAMGDVLRLFASEPELALRNSRFFRDEGLQKSLLNDGVVR